MRMILCILFLNLSTRAYTWDKTLGQVVFANILFRHGDRTPIDPYPNDPYKNESLWPVPFGQLTNIGKHQHLELGRWLQKRYAHLIPQKYSLYDIYVLSTDVDRTLMSAQANLAGIYPPYGDQIWDIKKWMPIPVHTAPKEADTILYGTKFCNKYEAELQKVLDSPEFQDLNKQYSELYKYLTEKSGKVINSITNVEYLHDNLFIEELYNKTLPDWTKSVYPEKLRPLAEKSFTIQAYNKVLQRLKSGPLLKDMIDHMKKKAGRKLIPDRKLWIYSGHDETVANLLMTLNLFEPHCPPYAATVLLELRINAEHEHIVTIFYKNSTNEPVLLNLPGCSAACPLSQFIMLTKDVIPDDWERECLVERNKYLFNVTAAAAIAILASSIIMFILVTSITFYIFWKLKKQYYLQLSMGTTKNSTSSQYEYL